MIWGKETRKTSRVNVRRKAETKKKQKKTKSLKSKHAPSSVVTSIVRSRLVQALIVLSLLIATLAIVGRATYIVLNKPIKNVRLFASLERVTSLEVEAVLSKYKETGFLNLSIVEVQNDLQNLPWVDRAEVKRSWPNGLQVTLIEQIAVARWGERGLLNSRGELILKDAPQHFLPPELPQLNGPEDSEWRVAQRYLDLHNLVKGHGLYLQRLDQDARGTWDFTLSNGTQVKLGKHETDERLHRFAKQILPTLLQQDRHAEVLDMRYSNGFTVKWRQSIDAANEEENEDA